MRVLSALVITHCFGCVIPEDSDDEFVRKPSSFGYKSISNDSTVENGLSAVHSAERYGSETRLLDAYDHLPGPVDTDFSRKEAGLVYLLPERSASVDKQDKSTQIDARKIASWHHQRRRTPRHRNTLQRPRAKRKISRSQNKNIESEIQSHETEAVHGENYFDSNVEQHRTLLRNHARSSKDRVESGHRTGRSDSETDESEETAEDPDDETGEWDDWTRWNQCSASCGCGRQVRWRHCSGKGCVKGLKKAQIKICTLGECEKKGFLSWLGIKICS